MPKSCSAINCKNRYNNKTPEITFHRFPFSKPSILRTWLNNIGREDFKPRKHTVICSLHFTQDCFSSLGNRKNLLWNAVPTLFPTTHHNNVENLKRTYIPACDPLEDTASEGRPILQDVRRENVKNQLCFYSNTMEGTITDHNYAILDPCATKASLFEILDRYTQLQKRMQTKSKVITRLNLRLQDAKREVRTLRHRLRRRKRTCQCLTH